MTAILAELVGGPKDGAIFEGIDPPVIGKPHRDVWGGEYVRTDRQTEGGATVYEWTPNPVET
jgi:hypothetical protein